MEEIAVENIYRLFYRINTVSLVDLMKYLKKQLL